MKSLPKIKGVYKRNFPLSKLTWFQTGGKAEILFLPKDLLDLQFFLKNIKNISINIIGGGSNLLIRDGGIKGVVIKLGPGFDFVNFKKEYILCGASVKNINLSNKMAKRKIKGYEFLSTIPGTIGGSIFMNAGCFGREIKNLVKSVIVLDKKGNLIELNKNSINFKYRSSGINKNYFIVATKLNGSNVVDGFLTAQTAPRSSFGRTVVRTKNWMWNTFALYRLAEETRNIIRYRLRRTWQIHNCPPFCSGIMATRRKSILHWARSSKSTSSSGLTGRHF